LGLYCSCISTHRGKKKSTQRTDKPTNYRALSAQKTYQAFIHAEEKPKDLRGVGAHRHRRARAREREERTNEQTNEWTDGRKFSTFVPIAGDGEVAGEG